MARKRSTQISNRDPEPTAQIQTSGFTDAALPTGYRSHPLVSGKYFYTLPPLMWDRLRRTLKDKCFDASILNLEVAASKHGQSVGSCVGFFNGLPITDSYLRPVPPLDLSNPIVAKYFSECQTAGIISTDISRRIDNTLAALKMPQKAYLGWLFTNTTFLTEFENLRTQFPDIFNCGQTPPQSAAFLPSIENSSLPKWLKPRDDSTISAVRDFCQRWRIGQILGPATFVPLGLQFPAPLPLHGAMLGQVSGSLLYIPDIAPLPDRDELRMLTEEVVRQTIQREAHLAKWFELIRAGNLGRRTLHTYADLYSLQHYARVLYSRHGHLLAGQKTKVLDLIGEYIELKSDQVKRTKKLTHERLGTDWLKNESQTIPDR